MKRIRSNSENKSVPILPTSVLEQHVIINLPVVDILTCRLVCKSWNHFIPGPEFFHLRKCFHPTRSFCTFDRNYPRLSSWGNDFPPICIRELLQWEESFLMSACNGLVCFVTTHVEKSLDGDELFSYRYYMCNPITGDWEPLPPPVLRPLRNEECRIIPPFVPAIAFDPFSKPLMYHVVLPVLEGKRKGPKFQIFSSKTGKWTTSRAKIFPPSTWNSFNSVKRPCRWSVFISGVLYVKNCLEWVIWLDPVKDTAGFIPLPGGKPFGGGKARVVKEIGELKDKNLLTCTMLTSENAGMWIRTKNGEWQQLFQVTIDLDVHMTLTYRPTYVRNVGTFVVRCCLSFSFTDASNKKLALLIQLNYLDLCGSENLSEEALLLAYPSAIHTHYMYKNFALQNLSEEALLLAYPSAIIWYH